MNFIKKHKILMIILILVFIIIISAIIMYIYSYQQNQDKYGNRLNGIENVIITDNKIENIKQKILNNNSCNKISYKLDGKIIKFFLDVKEETDEITLESIFNLILEEFSSLEQSFYDFEIFVTGNSKSYPIIAYKHRNSEIFSISRKEVIENEE